MSSGDEEKGVFLSEQSSMLLEAAGEGPPSPPPFVEPPRTRSAGGTTPETDLTHVTHTAQRRSSTPGGYRVVPPSSSCRLLQFSPSLAYLLSRTEPLGGSLIISKHMSALREHPSESGAVLVAELDDVGTALHDEPARERFEVVTSELAMVSDKTREFLKQPVKKTDGIPVSDKVRGSERARECISRVCRVG
jgi:hypothetical protein